MIRVFKQELIDPIHVRCGDVLGENTRVRVTLQAGRDTENGVGRKLGFDHLEDNSRYKGSRSDEAGRR